MAVNLTSKELIKVLDATPASQNLMLVGKHGIGKSEILTQYFSSKGMRVVALFLGQMADPGDLIGLPHKNETLGITEFTPPYWFPVDGKPIVLFLDELNRARPELLQTVMDLALNRKLAGRQLPEGSRIISAVNEGEEYQLTDLDPALVSRFNIYHFRPTVKEWLKWAESAGVDARVISFIQSDNRYLEQIKLQDDGQGLEKTPDRRGWKKVSDCILGVDKLGEVHHKLIAGIVGMPTMVKFFAHLDAKKIVTPIDVLSNYSSVAKEITAYPIHELCALNESIFRFIETEQFMALDNHKVVSNYRAYVEDLMKREDNEVFAHYISLIESNEYKQSVLLVLRNMKDLFMKMSRFIQDMKTIV